ncbi:MAG TPA: AAA family ATPase, partial [Polyangiaceae bacterium]|nr:AAA family ATPase [Polyangiaceae bacterium]
ECLTGAAVVRGASLAEIIERQLHSSPHALPAVLQHHRLGGLLSRVLEKDPMRRAGDANVILSLLDRITTQEIEDAHGYLLDSPRSAIRPSGIVLSDTVTGPRQLDEVERRDLIVVCCRLVLPDADTDADLEQCDAMLDDTSAVVSEVMEQFGATHCQTLGDCSVAYFGMAPTRDADARLAARMALELVNRLHGLPGRPGEPAPKVRAQVGIHAGPITVQLSEGRRVPLGGLTTRLAMDLSALSRTGDRGDLAAWILVSEAFRRLALRHAEFAQHAAAAPFPFRGAQAGVFELRGESRSSGLRGERPVFVGREAELRLLLAELEPPTGVESSGAAVLIRGEAGIGKSRLALELIARLSGRRTQLLEARCLPEWQSASMRPLFMLFLQQLGIAGLAPEEAGVRLVAALQQLGLNMAEAVPLFSGWLGTALPAGYTPLAWSPQKQRHLLHQLVADVLLQRIDGKGVLLVEDLHWADPSTSECLEVVFRRCRSRAAVVILTTRPGAALGWSEQPRTLELNALDPSAVCDLLSALLPNVEQRTALVQLAERSDGIPLYAEELALAFRASAPPVQSTAHGQGTAHEQGTAQGQTLREASSVPATLRDLLLKRLEENGPAQHTAQFAAALGREFTLELLAKLSDSDEFELLGDLEQLVSAELVVKRLRVEGPSYMFRHALIRDTAYDSMPIAHRQRTHERIAQGLERHFPELAQRQPDVLAHHFERAGHASQAVRYWQSAARKSNMASAHGEALAQLERAFAQLHLIGSPAERTVAEAELLLAKGATIAASRGYADLTAAHSFERVGELVPASDATLELAFAAKWGLWYFHNTRCNLKISARLATELGVVADDSKDTALSISAAVAACQTNFCIGHLQESIRAGRRCEALYDYAQHRHLATVRGDDPLVATLSFEALAELLSGRLTIALERAAQGVRHADRLGYPALQAGMHGQAAWTYLIWGSSGAATPEVSEARTHASLARAIAAEHGFFFWESYARMLDAAARIVEGDAEALEELRSGSEIWQSAGAALGRCWHLTFIASAYRRLGRYDQAWERLQDAAEFCAQQGSRYFEPEVRRHLAELLAHPENPRQDLDLARRELALALEIAGEIDAGWWLLALCTTSVRMQLEPEVEALSKLLPVVHRFEGLAREPPLLREARQLLRAHGVTA